MRYGRPHAVHARGGCGHAGDIEEQGASTAVCWGIVQCSHRSQSTGAAAVPSRVRGPAHQPGCVARTTWRIDRDNQEIRIRSAKTNVACEVGTGTGPCVGRRVAPDRQGGGSTRRFGDSITWASPRRLCLLLSIRCSKHSVDPDGIDSRRGLLAAALSDVPGLGGQARTCPAIVDALLKETAA